MKVFVICPVREATEHYSKSVEAVVSDLERAGHKAHWPTRDTDQSDPTGLAICTQNREAIAAANVVLVAWDGQSQGCLFDLGIAFAFRKNIIPINLPRATKEKSFQNMIRNYVRTRLGTNYIELPRPNPGHRSFLCDGYYLTMDNNDAEYFLTQGCNCKMVVLPSGMVGSAGVDTCPAHGAKEEETDEEK